MLQVTVYLRVVFLKIGEIDTLKEKYAADVFIQAKWREPQLDGKSNLVSHSWEKLQYSTIDKRKLGVSNAIRLCPTE